MGVIRGFGDMDLAVLAGIMSTGLFVVSYLPMLVKAARTKDLSSYSLGNLAITNAGNAVHSIYVFSLPLGPIWFLHTFYLVASALMLIWFLRYREARPRGLRRRGIVAFVTERVLIRSGQLAFGSRSSRTRCPTTAETPSWRIDTP